MVNSQFDSERLIADLYLEEDEVYASETVTSSISVRVNCAHAEMLTAISKRFNKSRSSIIKSIVESETVKMFEVLKDDDKEKLALEADKSMTKLMLDSGATIVSGGCAGKFENEWSVWREHVARDAYFRAKEPKEGEE